MKTPTRTSTPAERTRERVAALLLAEGPTTAPRLARRLGISAAGIRRHLDAMLAEGVLVSREQPARRGVRGRGRPARFYALSESGHERAPHSYDALALDALRLLDEVGSVGAFAARRAAGLAERYAGVGDATALAALLTRDGYAATVTPVPTGSQLCQHHCPVSHVAAAFPELCEAETAAISQLLGTHVQRLATIAHGDGVCTTHIPAELPRRA
ncbi:MAG: helix-turn-helix transcriptional regulator [Mycobacteriales bacterium]